MFRAHKTLSALFVALLLAALQLHAVLHLFEPQHADSEGPCAVCAESLQQQSLESPPPVQAAQAPLGFALAEARTTRFQPQFHCFAPLFRGPPAVS